MSAGLTISLRRAVKGSSRFNVAARNFAHRSRRRVRQENASDFNGLLSGGRCKPARRPSKGGRQAAAAPGSRRPGRREQRITTPGPGSRALPSGPPVGLQPCEQTHASRGRGCGRPRRQSRSRRAHRQPPARVALLSRRFRFGFCRFQAHGPEPLPRELARAVLHPEAASLHGPHRTLKRLLTL
jgi:hypothetical protein